MKKKSIHEMVESVTNIELIDVPIKGDSIVLLRTKEMPEFAFVMWVQRNTSTLSQMVFQVPNERGSQYPVVCACCASEQYGLEPPVSQTEDNEQWKKWAENLAMKFGESIASVCHSNGVHTIFMRRAKSWNGHYGDVDGLQVIEAKDHRNALLELHGRKIVRDALCFIDFSSSCGLGDG